MKLLIRFFSLFIIGCIMVSCSKDEVTVIPNVTYKATLKGSSEVPSNASAAIGLATLRYNPNTKLFTIVITHDLVAATGGHIHKGATGINGEVVFPFLTTASPITYTSVALIDSQLADLNAGLNYVNLHKVPNEDEVTMNEKDFITDMSGEDLDVPGSELDDQMEDIGSEDEENNYYSLGGDNHNNLDEQ